MIAKLTVATVCALLVGTLARPDKPSSGFSGYEVPQPRPSYSQPQPSYQQESKEEGMPFDFAFQVKDEYTGNDFSHNSDSDGEVTQGEYRVLLPDGRTQIVTYVANHEDGYLAQVTYEGEARHYEAPTKQQAYSAPQPTYQQPKPKPQPAYQPPQPKPQPTYEQPKTTYGF